MVSIGYRCFLWFPLIALLLGTVVAAQQISTVAGGGVGDGGMATSASVSGTGVWMDAKGNLYIAEGYGHRVRKVDATTGIISTIAGIGSPGFSRDGAVAAKSVLHSPTEVVVDSEGNLLIAEYENHRILRVDAATGILSSVAGTGSKGFWGDGGLATSAGLSRPYGLFLDSDRNLYIADTENHRIRKVDALTGIISTVAGTGAQGFYGDGGPAISAKLGDPHGIFVDGRGDLYIAESSNHRIRKVDAATGIISTVAGTDTMLSTPRGVFADGAGNLYIADYDGHYIYKVEAATGAISAVAGTGIYGPLIEMPYISGEGGPATSAQLAHPHGVFVDRAGNLYIADSSIRKVDATTGIITTIAGGGIGDGGLATSAQLRDPTAICVDSHNNLYIADSGNDHIRKVDAATGIITTVVTQLSSPLGVAVSHDGALYVADGGNRRVLKVDASTRAVAIVAGTGEYGFSGDGGLAINAKLARPSRLFIDKVGDLYISDRDKHRVRKVDAVSGVITTVAGSEQHGFSGDGGSATKARLCSPEGLYVDVTGNLYIADSCNNCVRKVDASSGVITTVAGGVRSAITGTVRTGNTGDGGPATSALLNQPYGVAVDGAGDLYIADSGNSCIRKVAATSGKITTAVNTIKIGGYSGDGGPATTAGLRFPVDIFIDQTGGLYISDLQNSCIRKVEGLAAPIPPTAVLEEHSPSVPESFSLNPNFPNPFNSTTFFRFGLPANVEVELLIYNLAGQQVATLVSGRHEAGDYTIEWDGRDDQAHPLATGVYLYRLQSGEQVETRKLLLLR